MDNALRSDVIFGRDPTKKTKMTTLDVNSPIPNRFTKGRNRPMIAWRFHLMVLLGGLIVLPVHAANGRKNTFYDKSFVGVDVRRLNPRKLTDCFCEHSTAGNTISIFEPVHEEDNLDLTGETELKNGFLRTSINEGTSGASTLATSNFSSFSKAFSIGVKVGAGANGVAGRNDTSFSHFENVRRSQESVYAFAHQREYLYAVSVSKQKRPRLDAGFTNRVMAVTTMDDAKQLLDDFGTHYARSITYGADLSAYTVLSKQDYVKAKGFGVDINAEVSVGVGEAGSVSGGWGFGFKKSQEAGAAFGHIKRTTHRVGGTGDGGERLSVNVSNAQPVRVDLAVLYELIEPNWFGGGFSPDKLKQKRQLVKTVTGQILADLPKVGAPRPEARLYMVTLKKIKVE